VKVYIGPYKNWFGPYQLAELLCFWAKKVPDEFGMMNKPDWVHDFGTWLAGGEDKESLLYKFMLWVDSKRKRNVKIRIDKYDTWSMDSTLSLLILPMLKQLQKTKHGAPHVDDEDVPEELRSTSAPAKENEWDTDGNHFKRWDWVMDEMIWTFEQLQSDYDWQEQYYSGVHDTKTVPCEWDEEGKPTMYKMEKGPNDTWKADWDAISAHQKRITNGLCLFGKYYQGLWD
jgi:hypothetical protein